MAAIVTGLIPILRTAVDTTTTYKGRAIWFGFLCIRLVTLFVAQMPWFKLDSDFACNDTKDVCTRACFNQRFDRPVIMAWNFLFILLVLSVIIMELFTVHVRTALQKKVMRETQGAEVESLGELKIKNHLSANSGVVMFLDMHGSTRAVLSYLFSLVLRVAVEAWFIYVLLNWNLSKLIHTPFDCSMTDQGCPVLKCIVRSTAEKRMSIYALLSISILVISISCLFCLYLIFHYFCKCCRKESNNT